MTIREAIKVLEGTEEATPYEETQAMQMAIRGLEAWMASEALADRSIRTTHKKIFSYIEEGSEK